MHRQPRNHLHAFMLTKTAGFTNLIPAGDTAHRALSSRAEQREQHRAQAVGRAPARETRGHLEDRLGQQIHGDDHSSRNNNRCSRRARLRRRAPRSCAPLPRSLARQRAVVVVADAADLSRSLAIIDAQQLVLSVAFLAALWFFAAPTGPFMVIEEETVYIDEEEEEEERFRW